MCESHLAASRQEVECHNSSTCEVSLRKTSMFELREELQLRVISPKSFTIAGTEIASKRIDVDPWCQGVAHLITEDRRSCRRTRCVATFSMRGNVGACTRTPLQDTSRNPLATCYQPHVKTCSLQDTHGTVLWSSPFGPTLSQRMLTESGTRCAAGLYVRRHRWAPHWP